MKILRLLMGFITGRPMIASILGVVLVGGGYFGWTWWKTANLQVKLNKATVEVIKQDAVIDKQNDAVKRLQKDGQRANTEADIRAIEKLTEEPVGKEDGYGYGHEEMNRWLSDR